MDNLNSSRRGFIGKTLMIPVSLFFVGATLQGCQTTPTGTTGTSITPDSALNFLSGIAAQLGSLLPQLVGLPANVSATVNQVLAGVTAGASALATAVGQIASQPVNAILGAGNAVGSALTAAGLGIPSWLTAIISDIGTLAPTILQVLGIVGIALAPTPPLDPVTAGQVFRHLMSIRAH